MTRLSVRAFAGTLVALLVSVIYVFGSIFLLWISNHTMADSERTQAYLVGGMAIAGIVAATLSLMKLRAGLWACAFLHIGFALYWVGQIATGAGVFAVLPVLMSTLPGALCLWAVLKPQL